MGLVERLVTVSPRCGETTVQKAAFIGQSVLGLAFGAEWRFHKHGPYSVGLRDELVRCAELGRIRISSPGGRRMRFATGVGPTHPELTAGTEAKLDLLTRRIGPMSLSQLEVFSTAAWATRCAGSGACVASRARRVHQKKPHINEDRASRAVDYLDELVRELLEVPRSTVPATRSGEHAREVAAPAVRQDVTHMVVARSGSFQSGCGFAGREARAMPNCSPKQLSL